MGNDRIKFSDTNFVLHTVYPYTGAGIEAHFNPRWQSGFFPIPSEFVVDEAKIVYPQQARVYRTNLFIPKESTDSQSHNEWIALVEVFEDHGDDGHTEMTLDGYAFFLESEIHEFRKAYELGVRTKYGSKKTVFSQIKNKIMKVQYPSWGDDD